MSYQVLARKWRPQTFTDVVGQEHVLTALVNSLLLGRIHHTYLLSGIRGVGKTTIARILAKGLNCKTGITATPCGQCSNCWEIEQCRFVDLIEIDAASRTKVEDTRDLLDNVQYVPVCGRFKVYLIDEVHMLSRHSFNALLKTLEEPPAYVKFLLVTTDPQKLPITILSRCLQFHLKALNIEQIYNQLSMILQQEHIYAAPRALQLLARAANGSMRDAMSLTDQAIAIGYGEVNTEAVSLMLGTLNTEHPLALIEAIVNDDSNAMIAQLEQCAVCGINWESLLLEMLSLLHRLAIGQLLPDQLNDEENSSILMRLRELSHRLLPADLHLYYQILLTGRKELPFAPNPRMGVEMTLLRALTFHSTDSADLASNRTVSVDHIILRDNVNTSTFAKIQSDGILENNLTASGSISEPVFTSKQIKPLLVDSSLTTEQFTVVDSTDKNFSKEYTDSSCDNDKNKKKQAKCPSERIIIKNTDLPPPLYSNNSSLPYSTMQLLQARTILMKYQERKKIRKAELMPVYRKATINTLERLVTIRKYAHKYTTKRKNLVKLPQLKAYCWHVNQKSKDRLALSIIKEILERDTWAAQVHQLTIPKIAQQLALNTWKEDLGPGKICLHLRTSKRYLNSAIAQNALRNALSTYLNSSVELNIIEDDNSATKTPLEWHKIIYEEKLMQARKVIMNDSYVQKLQHLFNAELDEESIQPV